MNELSELLARASAGIAPGFFRLSIHGGAPVYRERVYCYELYHQMRLLWPNDCAFTLNGEVDKTAHPTLTELGAAGFKPDLLVHRPGDMEGNHAVIEVKSVQAARQNHQKDLNTLALFKREVRYTRAIYLIYGEEITGALIARIAARYAAMALTVPIELWLHVSAGEPAFRETLLEPAA
ncbi:MAG: methionyl-tRNA formyltransferase-like protein [Pseudolabrys sp.]|nr:methionyl-tRNA formyltransferase-like protein [Pseudolabrys sp.]